MVEYLSSKFKSSIMWLFLIVILLIAAPLVLERDWVSLVIEIMIMALAGCAVNLMVGYGGLVHFGPAGLYAVGSYATALLLTRLQFPFIIALVMGPVMAALIGLIVGWFCVRRTAVYFALLTLAFSQVIWIIIFKWYNITNGEDGIVNLPFPEFLFATSNVYYFVLAVVLVCIFLIWRIVHSPFGKTLQAIRENALRAEFISVNVRRYQLAVFVVSSFFLGVAGSLFCLFSGSVFPEYAHWAKSADMLIVCLLGGIYNFAGPIVGSVVYIVLHKLIAKGTAYPLFYLGIIVILIVLFMRNGMAGFLLEKINNFRYRSGKVINGDKL